MFVLWKSTITTTERDIKLMTTLPNKAYFRIDEVAKYVDVHRCTLYRWIESGKCKVTIIAGHLKRISRNEVERLINEDPPD